MGKKKNIQNKQTGLGKAAAHSSKLQIKDARARENTPAATVGAGSSCRPLKQPAGIVLNCHEGRQSLDSSSDSDSESESRTLGDSDSSDCNPVASNLAIPSEEISTGSYVPETAMVSEGEGAEKKKNIKPSFASLFAGNRLQSNGSKLQEWEMEEGPVKISDDDMEDDFEEWKNCLVGYFGGRFPGLGALQQIVNSWKVQASTHFHNSGWIIFKFDNESNMLQVLQEGPYMAFGRPLLLKIMPKFFKFENEELSTFPVWVQFRNLPLELWSNRALSRICSKIGKPVYADKLTSTKMRVSFARALVEVDVSKRIMNSIEVLLPNGELLEQAVIYENLPRFCSNCKRVGHSTDGCKVLENANNKRKATANNAAGKTKTMAGCSGDHNKNHSSANQFHVLEELVDHDQCDDQMQQDSRLQGCGAKVAKDSSKQRNAGDEDQMQNGSQLQGCGTKSHFVMANESSKQRRSEVVNPVVNPVAVIGNDDQQNVHPGSNSAAPLGLEGNLDAIPSQLGKKKGKDKQKKTGKRVEPFDICAGKEGGSSIAAAQ